MDILPINYVGVVWLLVMIFRYPLTGCTLLLLVAVQPLIAAEPGDEHTTRTDSHYQATVYKTTDCNGRIAYSAELPDCTSRIQEIVIRPAPAPEYVDETRDRYNKINSMALDLGKAREQRQARRDKQEMERLQRLALWRAAMPQVYERTVYVTGYPWWRAYSPAVHYHKHRDRAGRQRQHKPTVPRLAPLGQGIKP